MFAITIKRIKDFFKGHERTIKAKKQIAYSFIIKGISIVIGFVFVPLILGYLDPERYGIWLTLSSVVTWFPFFEIGLDGSCFQKDILKLVYLISFSGLIADFSYKPGTSFREGIDKFVKWYKGFYSF